jgi:hypothetical protein
MQCRGGQLSATCWEWQCQAPSKLILFGEHAVIYGSQAIATSFPLYGSMKLRLFHAPFQLVLQLSHESVFEWHQEKILSVFEKIEVLENWDSLLFDLVPGGNIPLFSIACIYKFHRWF